jgi:hypothetical protein
MTVMQWVCFLTTLVIVLGMAVLAQLGWLPAGIAKTVIVFIAGVVASLSLFLGGLPPAWFDGSKGAFGIAVMITLGAFVYRTPAERAFGVPLHLGLGLTLLAVNTVRAIRNVF